jgi:hypothetical protein
MRNWWLAVHAANALWTIGLLVSAAKFVDRFAPLCFGFFVVETWCAPCCESGFRLLHAPSAVEVACPQP